MNNTKKDHGLIREMWDFLKVRKAWWIAPAVLFLLVIGFLFIAVQSSAITPFIYVLF